MLARAAPLVLASILILRAPAQRNAPAIVTSRRVGSEGLDPGTDRSRPHPGLFEERKHPINEEPELIAEVEENQRRTLEASLMEILDPVGYVFGISD